MMAQRLALLIGNSLYLDGTLSRLLTPDADVGALGELLLDPELGGFDDAKVMVNMSSHLIRRAIASFFAKKAREDLLLLYFSGHGVLDDQGNLFLAVRDTDSKLLSGTAISASYIASEMNNSFSQRQVMLLDCCHSGAFARGAKGQTGFSVGTSVAFEGTGYGRVVLTASDATQYAWEGDQIIGQAENSLFTHYMLEGIKTGKADRDQDGQITVDELYDYVYEQVVRQTPNQTPGKWSYKERGEIVLARAPQTLIQGSRQVKIPDLEQDHEEKLKQLYNEGLSAYWLEEWDKAVRCFESLVELHADYPDAANKLKMSKQNQRLLALYNQALAAESAQEWGQEITRLEELLSLSPAYRDSAVRLEKARRAKQFADLYQEARQLSQAGKWQAVVQIFARITSLQPDYPDPDELLPAAQREVAEIERRETMEDLYFRALREMDAGCWVESRELLTQLQEIEPDYRGTDRLMEKVEAEISHQQAEQQRAGQIVSLYEQGRVLSDARQWPQVLEKIQAIKDLDESFADPQGLEDKARAEIERQQAEDQRQIHLAARYAEAVQLLEIDKYQEALQSWAQVQAIDPAYPDRQKVQATAKKKLKELTQVSEPKRQLPRWVLAALSLVGVLVVLLFLTYPDWGKRLTQQEGTDVPAAAVPVNGLPTMEGAAISTPVDQLRALTNSLTPTSTPVAELGAVTSSLTPTTTSVPKPSATKTSIAAPTSAIVFPIIDNFNNPQYEGSYNPNLWSIYKGDVSYTITQQDGIMVLGGDNRAGRPEIMFLLIASENLSLTRPYFLEATLMVDASSYGAHLGLFFELPDGYAECQIRAWDVDQINCWTHFFSDDLALPPRTITPGTWHNIRIVLMGLNPIEFDFYIDTEFIGTIQPKDAGNPREIIQVFVHLLPYTEKLSHGYIEDISFGPER